MQIRHLGEAAVGEKVLCCAFPGSPTLLLNSCHIVALHGYGLDCQCYHPWPQWAVSSMTAGTVSVFFTFTSLS